MGKSDFKFQRIIIRQNSSGDDDDPAKQPKRGNMLGAVQSKFFRECITVIRSVDGLALIADASFFREIDDYNADKLC